MVVSETLEQAKDAAELVMVDYEPLKPVCDTVAAAAADAPVVWDDLGGNVCIDGDVGDLPGTEAVLAGAHHVVRLATTVSRVTGVPMEPRAALGIHEGETGRYTLHTTAGGAQAYRQSLADMFGVEPDLIRVVLRDVGGSFGPRIALYPECPLVLWAARHLGRPVKWTSERTETMLTDSAITGLTFPGIMELPG